MTLHTRRVFFERILTAQYGYEHSTSVVVRGEVSGVWSKLLDPQTRVEMDQRVKSAWHLGPEGGLGEISAWMLESGTGTLTRRLSAHEVIEYEHEHRVVMNGLTFQGFWTRSEIVIEPAGEGSVRISHRWWQAFPAGMTVRQVKKLGQAFADVVDRVPDDYARVFPVLSAEGGGPLP